MIVVIDQKQKWFEIPDATVLTARRYLAEPESGNEGTVRVLNLCRTGRYQGRGYYVSLLAEAVATAPSPMLRPSRTSGPMPTCGRSKPRFNRW